jgi:hypothetical protein
VLIHCHFLAVADPFLDLACQQVALVVAVHHVGGVFVVFRREEVQHYILFLQGLLSSSELDAAVGAVLEGLERLVEVDGFC